MNTPTGTVCAEICVFGNVDAPDFPAWILRHASKLGLCDVQTKLRDGYLSISAFGHEEMLNALALGCSLGPASIDVDRIEFTTSKSD